MVQGMGVSNVPVKKEDCGFEVSIGSCLVGRVEVQSHITKSIETKSEQLLFIL